MAPFIIISTHATIKEMNVKTMVQRSLFLHKFYLNRHKMNDSQEFAMEKKVYSSKSTKILHLILSEIKIKSCLHTLSYDYEDKCTFMCLFTESTKNLTNKTAIRSTILQLHSASFFVSFCFWGCIHIIVYAFLPFVSRIVFLGFASPHIRGKVHS